MDPDAKLEKQVSEYAAIGKQDPNVNVGMLMMNALQNRQSNLVSSKAKKWAYLISIGIPFAGFLCFLNYYLKDEDDAKQVAWTCAVLSVVCLLVTWLGGKLLLSGSGTSLDSISKIKLQDIQQAAQ